MPDMAKVVQPTLPIWRFIRHKFESERKMPRVTCPTLIVHSTGDELVPYTMADRLAAACGGPVTRVKIVGAGHSSVEMFEGGAGVIYEAMTKFFARL
jgi:pimeloyl-ACP methyl ester carboxylesterase